MDCIHDRIFYYWRNGFYGHIIKYCTELLNIRNNDLFLNVWKGLSYCIFKDFDNCILLIEKIKGRDDLSLFYNVCNYLIFKSFNKDFQEYLNNINNLIIKSNTFSISQSLKVCIMFKDFELTNLILKNNLNNNNFYSLIGWIYLLQNKFNNSLEIFEKINENNLKLDLMGLYGLAILNQKKGFINESIEFYNRILNNFNFPEILMEISKLYINNFSFEKSFNYFNNLKGKLFSDLEYNILFFTYLILFKNEFNNSLIYLDYLISLLLDIENLNSNLLSLISFYITSISCNNILIISKIMKLSLESLKFNFSISYSVLSFLQIKINNLNNSRLNIDKSLELNINNYLSLECLLHYSISTNYFEEAMDLIELYSSINKFPFPFQFFNYLINKNINLIEIIINDLFNHLNNPFILDFEFQYLFDNSKDNFLINNSYILHKYNYFEQINNLLSILIKKTPSLIPLIFLKSFLLTNFKFYHLSNNLIYQILSSTWNFKINNSLILFLYNLCFLENKEFSLKYINELILIDKNFFFNNSIYYYFYLLILIENKQNLNNINIEILSNLNSFYLLDLCQKFIDSNYFKDLSIIFNILLKNKLK